MATSGVDMVYNTTANGDYFMATSTGQPLLHSCGGMQSSSSGKRPSDSSGAWRSPLDRSLTCRGMANTTTTTTYSTSNFDDNGAAAAALAGRSCKQQAQLSNYHQFVEGPAAIHPRQTFAEPQDAVVSHLCNNLGCLEEARNICWGTPPKKLISEGDFLALPTKNLLDTRGGPVPQRNSQDHHYHNNNNNNCSASDYGMALLSEYVNYLLCEQSTKVYGGTARSKAGDALAAAIAAALSAETLHRADYDNAAISSNSNNFNLNNNLLAPQERVKAASSHDSLAPLYFHHLDYSNTECAGVPQESDPVLCSQGSRLVAVPHTAGVLTPPNSLNGIALGPPLLVGAANTAIADDLNAAKAIVELLFSDNAARSGSDGARVTLLNGATPSAATAYPTSELAAESQASSSSSSYSSTSSSSSSPHMAVVPVPTWVPRSLHALAAEDPLLKGLMDPWTTGLWASLHAAQVPLLEPQHHMVSVSGNGSNNPLIIRRCAASGFLQLVFGIPQNMTLEKVNILGTKLRYVSGRQQSNEHYGVLRTWRLEELPSDVSFLVVALYRAFWRARKALIARHQRQPPAPTSSSSSSTCSSLSSSSAAPNGTASHHHWLRIDPHYIGKSLRRLQQKLQDLPLTEQYALALDVMAHVEMLCYLGCPTSHSKGTRIPSSQQLLKQQSHPLTAVQQGCSACCNSLRISTTKHHSFQQ